MFCLEMNKIKTSVLSGVFLVFSSTGYADDVTDSIGEGLQHYNNNEYSEAVKSLNYASQLIQQKKGKSLESLLPEPLSGWTADNASSEAAGAAMFGGGTTAKRKYH